MSSENEYQNDDGLVVEEERPKVKRPPMYTVVLLNDDYSIIGSPILIYDGRVQSFSITDSNDSSTIVITASSHWADFQKKSGRRTNHNSQSMFFSGDKGFEFAPNTARDLKWGRA